MRLRRLDGIEKFKLISWETIPFSRRSDKITSNCGVYGRARLRLPDLPSDVLRLAETDG